MAKLPSWVVITTIFVLASGCGDSLTTGQPSAPPSAGLSVSCGDFPSGGCDAASEAVVKAVAGLAPVVKVELGRGILCPIPDLVQETTTCPRANLDAPGGGTWVGHAVVAFWNQDRRGFLNVSQLDTSFSAVLITVALPKRSG